MKIQQIYSIVLLCSIVLFSCKDKKALVSDFGDPQKLFEQLQGDQMKWWAYHKKYAPLYHDYQPIDEKNQTLTKKEFLRRLSSGDYISIKVYSEKKTVFYKLFRLEGRSSLAIREMISDDASREYAKVALEGKPFPPFLFTDLEGNDYNSQDLLGKIVFIKTWFVGCAPCIAEMPDLNQMVASFGERDNVVFISLALDKPERLRGFLTKTQFDYAVIPEQRQFINSAGVFGENPAYPTHVMINEEGLIEKVANSFEELRYTIELAGL